MKAVSCLNGELSVVELPTPVPASGQLLLEVSRCGICGSDLHARVHADELKEVMSAVGYDGAMRSDTPVVLGHEFCGEVLERGPGVGKQFAAGTRVVSFPLLRADGGVHMTGLSPHAPGAYAQRVLAEASLSFAVPNGLDVDTAALTEPMAVGLHAVRRSAIGRRDTAIVIGCGPVGLAVICHLRAMGVGKIIASDFSPARRTLAQRCGAHVVVDTAVDSPYSALGKGPITAAPTLYELAVGSMEKMRKIPGWVQLYRLADRLGATIPKRPVIFECVGVPGMIDSIVWEAPLQSRIVVAGVCMQRDQLRPALAVGKEIDMRFCFGYTPLEFRDTLHLLADGRVDASALVTGTVGLDGVTTAFDALGDPEKHAKILIDPHGTAATL
jgi:threonine dehydrogenase-like Zn-dependent dehydrogenase